MTSLVKCLNNRYSDDDDDQDEELQFVVFVSSSPEAKQGLLPHIITLNDYHIEKVGDLNGLVLQHISELDITDNLVSDWSEVLKILAGFPNLSFLNLSNNLLGGPSESENIPGGPLPEENTNTPKFKMRKLVLNGNRLDWCTICRLIQGMDKLEELHLSTNCLMEPRHTTFKHGGLRILYLSCNPISDFDLVNRNLVKHLPRLELLNLAECPVHSIPEVPLTQPNESKESNIPQNKNLESNQSINTQINDNDQINQINQINHLDEMNLNIQSLNVSTTAINSWQEVEKLRNYKNLSDLRIQGCKFLEEYPLAERRMMLISRLPNIKVLNGGDTISPNEREDAERAFIRYYFDTDPEKRPARFEELVQIHGLLEPLVNVDLSPEVNISVKIFYEDDCRTEQISVRQTVKQFKKYIQKLFGILPQNMRLYFCDQEINQSEEMKYSGQELYMYKVKEGDHFVVQKKAIISTRKSSNPSQLIFGPPSPHKSPTSPKQYSNKVFTNSNKGFTNSNKGFSTINQMRNETNSGYTSLNARTGEKTNFRERTPSADIPQGTGVKKSPVSRTLFK